MVEGRNILLSFKWITEGMDKMYLTYHIEKKTKIGEFLLGLVKLPRIEKTRVIVTHKGKRWRLIGTAFDYLVRMHISMTFHIGFEPRAPRDAINKFRSYNRCTCPIGSSQDSNGYLQQDCDSCFHKKTLERYYKDITRIIKNQDTEKMALYSLRFARLDHYDRPDGEFDKSWYKGTHDKVDVGELLKLIDLWQRSFQIPEGDLLINPNLLFSKYVGGAVPDLVVGRTIIDWKVTEAPHLDLQEDLAQLIGYALLLHLEEHLITICKLYFARQGILLSIPLEGLLQCSLEDALSNFRLLLGINKNEK